MTAKFTNPLDSIKVASPCLADWDAMVGNNRQRHCGDCKLDVYNLSGMTKQEAENLIMSLEGRLCARFYRRADGTMITKDCPVGWAAVKKRMSTIGTAVASLIFTALGSVGLTTYLTESYAGSGETGIVAATPYDEIIMGEVAIDENSNRTVDEHPTFTMGNVAVPQTEEPTVIMGDIENVEPNEETELMGKIAIAPK